MQSIRKIAPVLLLACLCHPVKAQKNQLTDKQYFSGNFNGIVNPLPVPGKWTDNTHFLLIKNGRIYITDAKTGIETESTGAGNTARIAVQTTVFIKNNDVFARVNDIEQQLTKDSIPEQNPVVSPDGMWVAFTKQHDLYSYNLTTKKQMRLTSDGSATILNGYASWVYMEEILGRPTAYKAYWWSPDSKHIAYFHSDESMVPEFVITDAPGTHGSIEITRYPKAGDPNPEVKVGIVSPEGGETVWAAFNERDDQYFGMPYWKPDGSELLVQWMNRLQNNLVIYAVDPVTGLKKEFYNEKQKTWISLDENDRIQFLRNGKGLLLLSDATGWRHIYHYNMQGRLVNTVTTGQFTVTGINYVDEKNGLVYFTARGRENTAHKDFYKTSINGKKLQRLSFGDFNHTVSSISPDGSYFISNYSNSTTPPALALVSNTGKIIKELANSRGMDFEKYELAKTELIRVRSDDSIYQLPMKVTWPTHMDKNKKYPVLISIYGGPNAGNTMDSWILTGNQQFYAKEGLIQVTMDHRASGHFGKDGVNYMYHNLGYWEMKDYMTMVKWLIANGNADPEKICITGFSYGGYISCYALTYGADIFTHAMAGGSVTDWTLYDSHYTERYMGTPQNNPEGYRTASVLTYADKFRGVLQLVHGSTDDNVHLQNSIRLATALQDLKKDFEMMFYSGGRHGWGGNQNAHFQNLKTKFIYRYLLEKDVPLGMLK